MFSRVSVNLFTGGGISLVPCPFWGWVSLVPGPFQGVDLSNGWVSMSRGRGGYVQGVPSWTWDLRRGGEDTTRYGWQAGSTYPTGLPCSNLQIVFIGVD